MRAFYNSLNQVDSAFSSKVIILPNTRKNYPFYHIPLPKNQKDYFAARKSSRALKLLKVLIDGVLFRFHSDRVLLTVLSDRILFESSVIGFSLGSSVTDSSLGSSVLFFRHVAIFLVLLLFHQK